jgi:butyryl-CoA dehydrogenase
MDFTLTDEQVMFRDLFREFAQNEVAPLADKIDREERMPLETLRKAAEMELLGVPFPAEFGGAGLDTLSYLLLIEEIGKECMSTAAIISVHTAMASMTIFQSGTDAQRQRFLSPLCRGESIGAFSLTEPAAGSDVAGLQTTALRDGDSYVLNGEKRWTFNADIAGTFVVFARTPHPVGDGRGVRGLRDISAFIVERDTPGLGIGPRDRKMGLRGASTNPVFLDDCRVPAANLLGEQEGQGWPAANRALEYSRIGLGALCLGVAEGALARSIQFAVTREQFGGPIALKGAIQSYLADMATEVEAIRCLVYRAAAAVDAGEDYSRLSAMCKLYASEAASRVVNKAVQVHGGSGYVKDYPIERIYRDIRAARLVEGTNEIQRYLIAADLLSEQGVRIQP